MGWEGCKVLELPNHTACLACLLLSWGVSSTARLLVRPGLRVVGGSALEGCVSVCESAKTRVPSQPKEAI